MTVCHRMSWLLLAVSIASAGCGRGDDRGSQAKVSTTSAGTSPNTTTTTGDHSKTAYEIHKGTWCEEHGVWEVKKKHFVPPERQCSLCMSDPDDVERIFKSKKDWCTIHERAKSQCFKCDPKLYESFAAEYKKRFGVDPPRPPNEEFEK